MTQRSNLDIILNRYKEFKFKILFTPTPKGLKLYLDGEVQAQLPY